MKIYPLMKADTMSRGTGGSVYHALTTDARGSTSAALCGSRPGKRGMWSSYLGKKITCKKCFFRFINMVGAEIAEET
jgi:hypothetical protein